MRWEALHAAGAAIRPTILRCAAIHRQPPCHRRDVLTRNAGDPSMQSGRSALSHRGTSCENGESSHDRRIPIMSASSNQATALRKWMCVVCGYIYDEAEGVPEEGIAPGTRWEDVPDTWTCPDCGTTKDDFEMIELD